MKLQRAVSNPLAITAVGLIVMMISGCTHSYQLRVMDKEKVEHRPCNYLGYYSTNWMPVESFGAVGWCDCQQPACRTAGACACVAKDETALEMDASVFDPPPPAESVDPFAPQWLNRPVNESLAAAVQPSSEFSGDTAASSVAPRMTQVTRLPKPQPLASIPSVAASDVPAIETNSPNSGPQAYFVGGRHWQKRAGDDSRSSGTARVSAGENTGVQWR